MPMREPESIWLKSDLEGRQMIRLLLERDQDRVAEIRVENRKKGLSPPDTITVAYRCRPELHDLITTVCWELRCNATELFHSVMLATLTSLEIVQVEEGLPEHILQQIDPEPYEPEEEA